MRNMASMALTGLLVVAACSHPPDVSTTSTTTQTRDVKTTAAHDPCSVLTKADVQSVTGKPVSDVSKTDDTHCAYGSPKAALGMIIVEASWSGADTQFQAGGMANAMMHDSTKAPKVGDASYSTAMGQLFYARKGDAYVGIDMRGAMVPAGTTGPALARRALARM